MNHPDEPGIFLNPAGPPVDEHQQPPVDGSDEAMRRLRHPFDVQETDSPDHRSGRRTVPNGRGPNARPEPDEQERTGGSSA